MVANNSFSEVFFVVVVAETKNNFGRVLASHFLLAHVRVLQYRCPVTSISPRPSPAVPLPYY